MQSLRKSWCLVLCLLAALASGCNSTKPSSEPMRFGLNPWPGFAPFYAAADRGFYGSVRVELSAFSTFYDIHRAFHQRSLEVAALPLFDALQMIDEGLDVQVVLETDYSNGADALIAPKAVATAQDLRGKRIAVELGTLPHLLVLRALERKGLTEADVVLVNMPADKAVEELKRGTVDAAEVWEPYLSQIRSDSTHALFTTAEVPGETPDVIVARRDVVEGRRQDLITVLRAWQKTLELWKTSPEQVEGVMARTMSMTPEELKVGAQGIVLADLARNAQLFDASRPEGTVWKAYELTAKFMVDHKLLKSPPRPAQDILLPGFVAEAAAK